MRIVRFRSNAKTRHALASMRLHLPVASGTTHLRRTSARTRGVLLGDSLGMSSWQGCLLTAALFAMSY